MDLSESPDIMLLLNKNTLKQHYVTLTATRGFEKLN